MYLYIMNSDLVKVDPFMSFNWLFFLIRNTILCELLVYDSWRSKLNCYNERVEYRITTLITVTSDCLFYLWVIGIISIFIVRRVTCMVFNLSTTVIS